MFLATRFRIWSIQEEFLSVGLWRQPISIHANKSAYQWGHKACSIQSHVSLARGMLVFRAFFSLYKIQLHGRAAVLEALEWSTCGAFAGNKMEDPICNFRSSLCVSEEEINQGHTLSSYQSSDGILSSLGMLFQKPLLHTLCSQITYFSNNGKPETQTNSLAFPMSRQQMSVSWSSELELSLLYHSLHGARGSFVHLGSAIPLLTSRSAGWSVGSVLLETQKASWEARTVAVW